MRATTAGEVFCISEQTVSVPPGTLGLTFEYERPPVVTRVAARSPLFGRVHAGAKLVAVDSGRHPDNIKDVKGGIFTKGRKGLLDARRPRRHLPEVRPRGVEYVGREGIESPMSADAVAAILAMDCGLFDAANAAKARTHWLHGSPGTSHQEGTVQFCCVLPFSFYGLLYAF